MKKILVLMILSLMAQPVLTATDADLRGSMQLKGSRKSSDNFLELLQCGPQEVPNKFLRKEKVFALSYSGGAKATLEEETNADEKYFLSFRVPSILRVAESESKKAKKEVAKFGTVTVQCVGKDEEPDNTASLGDNFDFLDSAAPLFVRRHHLREKKRKRSKLDRKRNKRQGFSRAAGTSMVFSVKKLLAIRKGSKGRLKGRFLSKEGKAFGRFAIKFDYKTPD